MVYFEWNYWFENFIWRYIICCYTFPIPILRKVAPPFKVVDFDVLFGSGIDQLGCVLDAAEACGVIKRRGSYYQYGEVKLGQGKSQAVQTIMSNNLLNRIIAEVKAVYAIGKPINVGENEGLQHFEGLEDGDNHLSPFYSNN